MCMPTANAPQASPLAVAPPSPLGIYSASTDPNDFSSQLNTQLSPTDETQYQQWATDNHRQGDSYDYDMRGAWKEMTSGGEGQADNGHFGDTFKKPNHPTFSDQSQYSKGDTTGGHWGQTVMGQDTFTPSATNLKNMSKQELQKYFDRVEPKALLRK